MYQAEIVAEAPSRVPHDLRQAAEDYGSRGPALVGLLILLIGLPLLAVRLFVHFAARDLGRVATLTRIVGDVAADARRHRPTRLR